MKQMYSVAQFIEEEGYEKSVDDIIPFTKLFEEYRTYCFNNNLSVVSNRIFNKNIRNLNFEIVRRNYGMVIKISKLEKLTTLDAPVNLKNIYTYYTSYTLQSARAGD